MNSKRILYIDDDQDLAELYIELMEEQGYEVWSATAGDEALELLQRRGQPDVILVDYSMPAMSGEDFILAARARFPWFGAVKVIGFTGFQSNSRTVGQFKELVSEIVQKPHDLEGFAKLLSRIRAEG